MPVTIIPLPFIPSQTLVKRFVTAKTADQVNNPSRALCLLTMAQIEDVEKRMHAFAIDYAGQIATLDSEFAHLLNVLDKTKPLLPTLLKKTTALNSECV